MPLTEIYCAAPQYRRAHVNHPVTLENCLACAATRQNPCQFTYELLSSMYAEQQDRGERISTTTLTTKCLRSEYLKRKQDFAERPEKLWPAFRGTMYHGQLEYRVAKGDIAEARYWAEMPGGRGPISGSPDLVAIEAGVLYDYKTTKEVPRFNYPWGDHVAQMNVNRWMVDHATHAEWDGETFDLSVEAYRAMFVPSHWTALTVVYIDDKGPKPLDCTRSEQVPNKAGTGTKSARVPDIWTDDVAEAYMTERYDAAKAALSGEGGLPPVPEYMLDFEHPLCSWCPVKQRCMADHFGVQSAV